MPRLHPSTLCLAPLSLAFASASRAQCPGHWVPTEGLLGTSYTVSDLTVWDPDGAGPRPQLLVAGGYFWRAGPIAAPGIAAWDPLANVWSLVGNAGGSVWALATRGTELIATGDVLIGAQHYPIVRYDGSQWQPIATSISTAPWDGAWTARALPDSSVVVAGRFTAINGAPFNNIARWDGAGWSALGDGVDGAVNAVCVRPNGQIFAGGSFQNAGGHPASRIARWDGASWVPLGAGLPFTVNSIALLPGGQVAAGGSAVARWDGTTWTLLGPYFNESYVYTLFTTSTGALVAGLYVASGQGAAMVTWNGSSWVPYGPYQNPGYVYSVRATARLQSGELAFAGDFATAGGRALDNIAVYDGTSCRAAGRGLDGAATAFAEGPSGDLFFAGQFEYAGDLRVNHIARRSGDTWFPLGSGTDMQITCLALAPGGPLYAGGDFLTAGGTPARRIARWDGATWSALEMGLEGQVQRLAVLTDGQLVAAGQLTTAGGLPVNNIARWTGATWFPLGEGTQAVGSAAVNALLALPDGSLVAAGDFTVAGGIPVNRIARWDGQQWLPMGAGTNGPVHDLVRLQNGDILAAGAFSTAGLVNARGIARWNGYAWSAITQPLNYEEFRSLASLPDGTLAVSGRFYAPTGETRHFATFDGVAWTIPTPNISDDTQTLFARASGELLLGGVYSYFGGTNFDGGYARWSTMPACYANCDCSTASPALNALDFNCFLNRFTAAHPYANCDHSTTPPVLNALDFNCFLNAFTAGCP